MAGKQSGLKSLVVFFFLVAMCADVFLLGVMYPVSTRRLAEDSCAVVRGEVVDLNSYWSDNNRIIFTRAKIHVYETVKGDIPGQTADVEYPGGKIGQMEMVRSDQPRLMKGQQVLLFLKDSGSFKTGHFRRCYQIVEAAQGAYSIGKDGVARKGGFTLLGIENENSRHPGAHRVESRQFTAPIADGIMDNNIPVAALIRKIQGKNPEPGSAGLEDMLSARDAADAPGLSRPMYNSHGSWKYWTVALKINPSGGPSFGVGGILAGMKEWNHVYSSSFKWLYLGATTGKSVSRNNANTVYFSGMGGSQLGYSNWWYSGGYIIETDVQLRSNYGWNFTLFKSVVMHELGHSLGLSHVSGASIMKVPITYNRLLQDEINAVSYLYPAVTKSGNFNGDLNAGNPLQDLLFRKKTTGQVWIDLMNGTTIASKGSPATVSLNYQIKGIADFNNDGKDDILWRNHSTGQVYIYLLDGVNLLSSGSPSTTAITWQIHGIADFNGDGKADILWRKGSTGQMAINLIDGTTVSASGNLGLISIHCQVIGVGDFNGDGNDDLLLRYGNNGKVWIYLMNGTTISSAGSPSSTAVSWRVEGIADFNGDGKDDILWRKISTGQMVIHLIDGTTVSASGNLGSVTLNCQVKGFGDFNGDGKDDILLRYVTSGKVWVYLMNGASVDTAGTPSTTALSWRIQRIADFDGDGKDDILWRKRSTGQVVINLMNGTSVASVGDLGVISQSWLLH